jgi:hypothetical protein
MAVGHGLSYSSSSSNGVAGVRVFDPAKHRREAHIPGGEPLPVVLALSVGSRRLPGMSPGQGFAHRVCSVWHHTRRDRTATRRDVHGSRLLHNDRAAML